MYFQISLHISYVHAAVNPLLFMALHRALRRAALQLCCGCCVHWSQFVLALTAAGKKEKERKTLIHNHLRHTNIAHTHHLVSLEKLNGHWLGIVLCVTRLQRWFSARTVCGAICNNLPYSTENRRPERPKSSRMEIEDSQAERMTFQQDGWMG